MSTNVHPGTEHTMTTNKENNRSVNIIDQIKKIPIDEPVTEFVYNMHKNGASIDSISQEMNILRKTVCTHLCKAIENGHPVGQVSIDRFTLLYSSPARYLSSDSDRDLTKRLLVIECNF